MLNVIEKTCSRTVGFVISVRMGSGQEPADKAGYLHAAEHFMFSGTESMSRVLLRGAHFRLFDTLEARTSRENIVIFGTLDYDDMREGLSVLHEMIYKWKCRPSVFSDERSQLVREEREFSRSLRSRRRRIMNLALRFGRQRALGNPAWLRGISMKDVLKIKSYWDKHLREAPMDLLLVGPVTSSDRRYVSGLFSQAAKSGYGHVDYRAVETRFIRQKHAALFVTHHTTRHHWAMLLDRVLYIRWFAGANEPPFNYVFEMYQDMTVFGGVKENEPIDVEAVRKFFLEPITKDEFEEAKRMLKNAVRLAYDGLDWPDELLYLEGFNRRDYGGLKSMVLDEIVAEYMSVDLREFADYAGQVLNAGA